MTRKRSKKKLKRMRRKQQRSNPEESPAKTAQENDEITNRSKEYFHEPKDLKPPPVVAGSRKRIRSIVEFVYPKDSSNESKPYVFDKQRRTPQAVGTSDWHDKSDQPKMNGPKVAFESIDDIFFPKEKKSRERQAVEETGSNTKAQNGKSWSKEVSEETTCSSDKDQSRKMTLHQNSETRHHDDRTEGGRLWGLSVEDAVRDKVGCRPRANSTDGELNLPRRGLCDERMVLEAHRWKDSMGQTPPRGFANLGNTCFLNAIIQCLAYLPTFSQTLLSLPVASGGNNGQKMNKGQRITAMLSALFCQVHGINGSKSVEDKAISPHGIVRAVPSLGTGGSRCGHKFRPGQQEDAHEFLVHLLDAMQDGELKSAGIDQHATGWRDRLPVPRLDETTFINRIFGGYLRSQVQCTKCGYRSNTYDPFLDLSLEVSKKSLFSVASAFSEFTRKETLDSRNRWKCSGCKKHVCATKQLTVFRPPLSLCIQLKRFTYGGFGSFSNGWGFGHYVGKGMGMLGRGGSKISKPIDFPAELNLPLSDGRKCEYHLTGVVVHIGGSASSGHYTAFVKKPGDLNKHQWYHMDDSFVEAVSEKTVLKQKDAYVLFYCRKEVKIEYPSPPPRGFMSAEAARESGIARARARSNSVDMAQLASSASVRPTSIETSTDSCIVEKKANKEASHLDISETARTHPKVFKPSSVHSSGGSSSSSSDDSETGIAESCVAHPTKEPSEARDASDSTSMLQYAVTLKKSDQSTSSSSSSSSSSESDDGSASSESTSDDSSERSSDSREKDQDGQGYEEEANNKPMEVDDSLSKSVRGSLVEKDNNKTRVVVDRGGTRGKLEVMLGPRRGFRAWKPPHYVAITKRDAAHELLGSVKVNKWDDPADGADKMLAHKLTQAQSDQRTEALKQLDKRDRSRKRKMHVDRWDALLDEGKKKKVKQRQEVAPLVALEPKKNPFHRIQSGMQRMNRGKAKGWHGNGTNMSMLPHGSKRNKKRS